MGIFLTVYADAVKVETEEAGIRRTIGWFQDEVEAVGAAIENLMMQSAINPACRKVPELNVSPEYRKMRSGHATAEFKRGTVTKTNGVERSLVMRPAALGKGWIAGYKTYG